MSFGKPVNSRTLAGINRANASFHGTQDDAGSSLWTGETTAPPDVLSAKKKTSPQLERSKSISGKEVLSVKMPKPSKEFLRRQSGNAKDISHENGKQVIKQKGQVVAQHDEGDAFSPAAKQLAKSVAKGPGAGTVKWGKSGSRGPKEQAMRQALAKTIKSGHSVGGKDSRDSFPATDKTIADVNAANARFHSADGEDAEYKSNFNSSNERPPYLEVVPATKKKDPAKPAKDWHEGQWFPDPKLHAQTGREAAQHLSSMEMVHTKKGEEIRSAGSYEKGDFNPKKRAPKASAFHGDAFPATDKTLASINDANLAYYNNSPHAGNAQDAEPEQPKVKMGTPYRTGFGGNSHTVRHDTVSLGGKEIGSIQTRQWKNRSDVHTNHNASQSAVMGHNVGWLVRQHQEHSSKK